MVSSLPSMLRRKSAAASFVHAWCQQEGFLAAQPEAFSTNSNLCLRSVQLLP